MFFEILKTFNEVVNTIFWNDGISQESVHCTCIAAISIDSIMKTDKKNYPQVYVGECEYEIKKKKMSRFIDIELDLNDLDDSNYSKKKIYFFCFNCLSVVYSKETKPKLKKD